MQNEFEEKKNTFKNLSRITEYNLRIWNGLKLVFASARKTSYIDWQKKCYILSLPTVLTEM